MTHRSIVALVPLLLLGGTLPGQEADAPPTETVTALLPLRAFGWNSVSPPIPGVPAFRFVHLISDGGVFDDPRVLAPTIQDAKSLPDIVSTLQPGAETALDQAGHHLQFEGSRKQLQALERNAAALRRWALQRIRVRATAYFDTPDPGETILTADQVAAYRKQHRPTWTSTRDLRLGGVTALGNLVRQPVAAPQNQLAQNSTINSSRISTFAEGFAIRASAHGIPGRAELVAIAQVAAAQRRGEVKMQRTARRHTPSHLPVLGVSAGAMSAIVPEQGAMVWRGSGSAYGSSLLILVEFRRREPSIATIGSTTVVAASALLTASLSAPAQKTVNSTQWAASDDLKPGSAQQLEEFIHRRLGKLASASAGGGDLVVAGGNVFVTGPPAFREAVAAIVRNRITNQLQTTHVEITHARDKPAGTGPIASLRFPALTGCHHTVCHGRQELSVNGVRASVAAGAHAVYPQFQPVLTGFQGSIEPWVAGPQRGLSLNLESSAAWAEREVFLDPASKSIPMTAIHRVPIIQDGPIRNGSAVDLGAGAAANGDQNQRMLIFMRH